MHHPRLRIGNQTAFSAPHLLDPFQFALQVGFDAFEWFVDNHPPRGWDFDDLDGAARAQLRGRGAQAGIRFSVHAPWDSDPRLPAGEQRIVQSVDFAREIGATRVIVHLRADAGEARFAAAIAGLVPYACDAGVQLCLENIPSTDPNACNRVFRAIWAQGIAPRQFGMCLDVGHANLCEVTRNDYLKFVDCLDPQLPIRHVHLHENYGDWDRHLVAFTGPSRYDSDGFRGLLRRLHRRQFDGAVILEQWPLPPALLLEAQQRLLRLWDEVSSPPPAAGLPLAQASSVAAPTAARQPRARAAVRGDQVAPGARRSATAATSALTPKAAAGADPRTRAFAQAIAAMNQQRRSWRRRLEWIRDTVTDPRFEPTANHLATLAIYLQWLGTGTISCEEDGGHHRPSRHALAAAQIETALLQPSLRTALPLIRRILPWLPSHDAAFRSSEPLTRIRDIAHRNDIPAELKQRIKHQLQNKLHRSAGPEDLVTSGDLLTHISAPNSGYSPDFVEQFRRFHGELQEFFHAGGLDAELEAVLCDASPPLSTAIEQLLALRRCPDHSAAALDRLLQLITQIRVALQPAFLAVGDAASQRRRIADIRLEEQAFVVFSERVNQLQAGAAPPHDRSLLNNLVWAVQNVGLYRVDRDECAAICQELGQWQKSWQPGERDLQLRLLATLQRVQRLTADHVDRVLSLLPPRVELLGQLLGVSRHRIQMFGEGELRRSIVFQLSKLAALAHAQVRKLAGLPGWEVVVPGCVRGRLVEAATLAELSAPSCAVVVLLHRAEGDEELPSGVRGVVLAHPIPHLSHLGLRARQHRVAFATLPRGIQLQRYAHLVGQLVQLTATLDRLELGRTDHEAEQSGRLEFPAATILPPPTVQKLLAVPLSEADPASIGPKAAAARRLLRLSESSSAEFRAPNGCVLPFGVMETCIRSDADRWDEYQSLARLLDQGDSARHQPQHQRLCQLLGEVPIPSDLVAEILQAFPPGQLLAVRSSCSAEDLAGWASAGLYDSVVGVTAEQLPAAIRQVFSSLWTRRAMQNRQRAGFGQREIRMAVLIQEAVAAELSYVMHTRDPTAAGSPRAYVELAAGLGETLCSATSAGSPYRVFIDRKTGQSRWTSFASYSHARHLDPHGGVRQVTVDYSCMALSTSPAARHQLAARLRQVADRIEAAFGSPQNVEGAWTGGHVHVVQSRPLVAR